MPISTTECAAGHYAERVGEKTANRSGVVRHRGIRPLERSEVPQMASFLAGTSDSAGLTSFLEQVLFDHPWADPETPSLAYVEDGELLGAIGACAKRMRFEGEEIRMVVSALVWSHPRVRSRGVGVRLLRALLAGPQDLTITDGATDTVRQMWEMLGGRTAPLNWFAFHRIFQPWRFGATWLNDRRRVPPLGRFLVPAAGPLDQLTGRFVRMKLEPRVPSGEIEPLTPTSLAENAGHVTGTVRLHVDYDEKYLEWMFEQLRRLDDYQLYWLKGLRGSPWAELVCVRGEPIGWYICLVSPAGRCRVVQLAATDRGAPTVVGQLLHRAASRGVTAISGRLEHRLVAPLVQEPGLMRFTRAGRMLVHARDERITNAVLSGDALLTNLDGDWWV